MKAHIKAAKVTPLGLASLIFVFSSSYLYADLQPLDDEDLESVTGQLGIIVDDVKFFGHPDANIQLTFDTSLNEDSGYLDHISVYGSDSSPACDSSPAIGICSGINIGIASDPMKLNFKNDAASGIAYLEFLFPQNTTSESGIDANFRVLTNTYASTGKIDISWVSLRDLKLAGTTMKLWSHGVVAGLNGGQPIGASVENVLNAEFDLSIDFANSRIINNEYEKLPPFSASDTANGGTKGILALTDVKISDMRLGLFPYLPVTAGTINRDQGKPGFDSSICSAALCAPDLYVEMPRVTGTYNSNAATQLNNYNNDAAFTAARALYATPRATVTIGNITLGDNGSGSAYNVGSASIQNIRIQHLRLETRG